MQVFNAGVWWRYLERIPTGAEDVNFSNDSPACALLNISQNMNCETIRAHVLPRLYYSTRTYHQLNIQLS